MHKHFMHHLHQQVLFRSPVLWSDPAIFIYFEDALCRYYTRTISARLMDHPEQENCELEGDFARLSTVDGFIPG